MEYEKSVPEAKKKKQTVYPGGVQISKSDQVKKVSELEISSSGKEFRRPILSETIEAVLFLFLVGCARGLQ